MEVLEEEIFGEMLGNCYFEFFEGNTVRHDLRE